MSLFLGNMIYLCGISDAASREKENPGILKYPGTEIIKIKSAVPPALNPALRLILCLRLALVKCFRFHSLHVNGCFFRTALLRFRRSAPKCSLSFLRCPALSVGDANFLSVSENQSLVHCLSLFQHFSLLKYVSNITIRFFILQELFLFFLFFFAVLSHFSCKNLC